MGLDLDRAASIGKLEGDGAPETDKIEITPEMIRAGTDAYLDFDLRFGDVEDRVEAVLRAALSIRRTRAIVGD